MNTRLYKIIRIISKIYLKLFYRVQIINSDNIPKSPYILAGNHKSNLDCILLMISVKDNIHFFAKKELLDTKLSFIYKKMGIIPVDRKKENKEAYNKGIKLLKNNSCIGIFPEATFNKTEYIIVPFKTGAVRLSIDTNTKIVPFAIVNDYKLFRKSVKIIFDKPYQAYDKFDIRKENITLMNKVIKLIINENTR